ncbi:MAG TPA: Ig-like domain-containing protein [Gemmatimonadaceae bacterium]|nr:Ig-like domain-containing protein [Gemmatimonadaceae bacterium]
MTNRLRLALLPLCTLALTVACGGGDSSGPPAVATVDVSSPSGDIVIGQTAQLIATPRDAKGNTLSGRTITWSTSSASIATVSTAGLVTGVAPGSAIITATADGKSGTRSVIVVPQPVASVTVTAASEFLRIGETTQLTAVVRDGSNNVIQGRTVTWITSDAAVATVSAAGVVTGVASGLVTITGSVGTVAGSVLITVDPPEITAVTALVEGQPATITGTKFATAAGGNVVRVGGVPATITAATATSIQIVVPKVCRPASNIAVDVTARGARSASKSTPFAPAATFALAVGQQRVITNPSDFCLQFGATGAAEKYVFGVQSVVENVNSVTSANVTADVGGASIVTSSSSRSAAGVARASIASAPVFSSAVTLSPLDARAERLAKHRAVEGVFLARDRELFQSRLGARRAAARTSRPSFSRTPTVTATAKVGDVLNIRVPNRASNTCQNSIPIAVTVKMIGQRGIFVEDNGNPTGGFTTANYQALSDQFDAQIYATDVAYFGEPTDADANSRIVIVLTKEVNKVANLLGQVFTADLFPQSDCPASNEGEFYYGRVPDPSGTAGAAYTAADALLDAPILIAHEFSHIIQLGRRINYEPATAFQSTWELEGQATFAEEVNGYTATGLTPGQNLGFEIAFNNPPTQPISWFIDPFVDLAVYYGFASATSRVAGAPEQCSWLGTRSQGNNGPCLTGREPYGVPWSFFRWLSDQYGSQFPGGEKGLHRALIDNQFTGFATITSVIGTPMEALLAQWAPMLYIDDRFPGTDPKLSMKSWNLFAIEQRLNVNARLAPRDRQFAAFTDQISVRGGSSAYYVISGAGRPATAVRVRDISDAPLLAGMQMWIVRVQ